MTHVNILPILGRVKILLWKRRKFIQVLCVWLHKVFDVGRSHVTKLSVKQIE
jgi:hypothetical protein